MGKEKQGVRELFLGDLCTPFIEMENTVQPSLTAEDKSVCAVTTSRVGQ